MTVSLKIINILSGKQNRTAVVKANTNKILYNTVKCYYIEGNLLCDYRTCEEMR